MQRADKLRLETIAFVYAAVVGYGFSVWKGLESVESADYTQWTELLLYLGTIGILAIDYAFVREIYAKEGAYGKWDFVIDIFVVFCFSRMLASSTDLYVGGAPTKFYWWFWLGIVFATYVLWDIIRWVSYGTAQKWTIAVDSIMAILALGYFIAPKILVWFELPVGEIYTGVWPGIISLISVIAYFGCAWVWRHEALSEFLFTFRVTGADIDQLNNGTVPQDLRDAFDKHKSPLSSADAIAVTAQTDKWQISDSDKRPLSYVLQKDEGVLNIFKSTQSPEEN